MGPWAAKPAGKVLVLDLIVLYPFLISLRFNINNNSQDKIKTCSQAMFVGFKYVCHDLNYFSFNF
jgi:hypothetical protein